VCHVGEIRAIRRLEPDAALTRAGGRWPPQTSRRRERALLGWLSFGVALMVGGLMWALQDAGSAHLSLAQILGAPLAVLGAGLLLASFVGRGRWTILPALLLVPPALVASLIHVPLDGVWTDRTFTPRTAASIGTSYQQSGDRLVFDFTKLEPDEHPSPIHAEMGIGKVLVIVPRGMPLTIHAEVGAGTLTLLARPQTLGFGVEDTVRVEGADPLVMDVQVGIGDVEMYLAGDRRDGVTATPAPKREKDR
jgi:hypothetical protein